MKKKFYLIAFCIVVLCSLSLSVVLVSAYKEGYANNDHLALVTPVEDGKYTNSTEWDDAALPPNLPAGLHWKEKWTYPENIIQHFIIEALTDTTNDTGDYFQLCYDCNANGGTAPQPDDIKIEYVGHSQSGLKIYVGNGTAWTEFTGSYTYGTDLFIAESFSSSALSSTAHWIIELRFDKTTFIDISGSGYQPWIRVAVYDASNSAAGVKDWPPASADVPNNWGLEIGTMDPIPEPLTIIAVVVLSTVAVIFSFHFLRRRPKSTNLNFGKLTA